MSFANAYRQYFGNHCYKCFYFMTAFNEYGVAIIAIVVII